MKSRRQGFLGPIMATRINCLRDLDCAEQYHFNDVFGDANFLSSEKKRFNLPKFKSVLNCTTINRRYVLVLAPMEKADKYL